LSRPRPAGGRGRARAGYGGMERWREVANRPEAAPAQPPTRRRAAVNGRWLWPLRARLVGGVAPGVPAVPPGGAVLCFVSYSGWRLPVIFPHQGWWWHTVPTCSSVQPQRWMSRPDKQQPCGVGPMLAGYWSSIFRVREIRSLSDRVGGPQIQDGLHAYIKT